MPDTDALAFTANFWISGVKGTEMMLRYWSANAPVNSPAHSRGFSTANFLEMEFLEGRVLLSAAVRPIDEVGNNIANPAWGTAGVDLIRIAAAAYADGISSPNLSGDQSARIISNILNNQADPSDP